MKAPINITNAVLLEESGLVLGDPVHVAGVGPPNSTNDAEFAGRIVGEDNEVTGIKIRIRGELSTWPWEDLIEFWSLPHVLCYDEPRKNSRMKTLERKLYGDS